MDKGEVDEAARVENREVLRRADDAFIRSMEW